MPLVYTKEEIKEYLSNRGFDVNDEEVIKKFIHDLKKLVKYEDRRRRRQNLGHNSQETNLESSGQPGLTPTAETKKSGNGVNVDDVDDSQQIGVDPSEPPFRASAPGIPKIILTRPSKEKTKTVGRGTHKSRMESTARSRPVTADPNRLHPGSAQGNRNNGMNLAPGRQKFGTDSNKGSLNVGRELQKSKMESSASAPSGSGGPKGQIRPISAPSGQDKENQQDDTSEILYILGNILGEEQDDAGSSGSGDNGRNRVIAGPSDAVKRDPVALYYYYKKFWDKQNFPGDNRHMKLRWNVRAQTVGNYPCIDGHAVKYLR